MACKLPMALNTDMRSIAFRYSTFIILFLTSYYIVSKWWPTSEWKKKTLFFFARKIVAAGQRGRSLLLSSLDMTLFTASHTCDVSHAWSKSERFQNGRWLSVKKNWFCTIYHLFAHPGFFDLRGMYWNKNKQTNKQTKKEKFGVSYSLNH